MGFLESFWYYLLANFLVPKNREEVPFKQMGFDLDQFVLLFVELGLYEAAIYEAYKGVICWTDPSYGYSQGWCPKPVAIDLIDDKDDDERKATKSETKDSSDKLYALTHYLY